MLSIEKKYCLIVYLCFCTFLSVLVIDDNYSFYFLAEKKALLSQVRSTESFLDKFVMYFCFSPTFYATDCPRIPTPTFPWIYFPVLQTGGRASSVVRALACRAWVCWFISWGQNYPGSGNSGGMTVLPLPCKRLNLRLARMTVCNWRLHFL